MIYYYHYYNYYCFLSLQYEGEFSGEHDIDGAAHSVHSVRDSGRLLERELEEFHGTQ